MTIKAELKRSPADTLMEALSESDDKRHAIVILASADGTVTVFTSLPLVGYELQGIFSVGFEVATSEEESNDD